MIRLLHNETCSTNFCLCDIIKDAIKIENDQVLCSVYITQHGNKIMYSNVSMKIMTVALYTYETCTLIYL